MLQSNVITMGDHKVVTVFAPGSEKGLYSAADDHPNFEAILAGVEAQDESVVELFDIARTVGIKFAQLSERVVARDGRVYFDDDEVDDSIAKQIIRAIDEDGLGSDSATGLVNFMEKVASNPQEHSREQLYDWLDKHEFTITVDGDIVGYKGVTPDRKSTHSGSAYVNGELVTGQIPYQDGDVVTMPRSEVQHDPTVGCHKGLHVGTYEYASGWASLLLEVHVNPRDVVSVPTDCNWQKVRACRLEVIGTCQGKYGRAVIGSVESDLDEDELVIGARVVDEDGDEGKVVKFEDDLILVDTDDYGRVSYGEDELEVISAQESQDTDVTLDGPQERRQAPQASNPGRRTGERNHGKGGATSFAAKGNGRNAAQDAKGRFSNGRPGSSRDTSTGRFA